MVFVADEQQVAPDTFRVRGDLWNASQDCALEIQLEQHAQRTCEAWIHGDREIQREHVTGLEQLLERCQRPGLARLRVVDVRAAWRAERSLDCRISIE